VPVLAQGIHVAAVLNDHVIEPVPIVVDNGAVKRSVSHRARSIWNGAPEMTQALPLARFGLSGLTPPAGVTANDLRPFLSH
jgi:hypothetical protein